MVRPEGLSEYLPIVDTALGFRRMGFSLCINRNALHDHDQDCMACITFLRMYVFIFLHAHYRLYDASAVQNLYKRVHTSLYYTYGASSNARTIP
jgi:hypothetical protein